MTYKNKKVIAVVQARMTSTRFRGKVIAPILNQPALEVLLKRLAKSNYLDSIVLAVPNDEFRSIFEEISKSVACHLLLGDELDVLSRFAEATTQFRPNYVVRITGDCPAVDASIVDRAISKCIEEEAFYVRTSQNFPDGLDVEVVPADLLLLADSTATLESDREHVLPWVVRYEPTRNFEIESPRDFSKVRLTLDEKEDLEVLQKVFQDLGSFDFQFEDLVRLLDENPEYLTLNEKYSRNEGATMSSGEKLWKRAKKVIPNGNMLLSKRAEMHLASGWPAYFSRTQGCYVWDLDGVRHIDCGYMGVGTNILGYSHPEVDAAVAEVVRLGNMSTLNCPEEVYLAERLVDLHPWAEMVRFTRSGGEACSVAVRIARAYTGKSRVAFCGYHGWHDWYLSANLSHDEALDGHLLPGLKPSGVPRELANTSVPFNYNDIATLEKILIDGNVAAIFMEVRRAEEPQDGFLQKVRSLANKFGVILIFDECTSGFRKPLGGLHLVYGVEPDIAVFGKTLGNGYAINAIIGREDPMKAVEETFISSTFWTERIGPTAGLKSLEVMEKSDATHQIDEIGKKVVAIWENIAKNTGLDFVISGLPSLATFSIGQFDSTLTKTFIAQEMLKQGFLAGTAFYSSIAHTDEILELYSEAFNSVIESIASCSGDKELLSLLAAGPAQSGFKRLA